MEAMGTEEETDMTGEDMVVIITVVVTEVVTETTGVVVT